MIGRDLYVCTLYGDGSYYAFRMLPGVTYDPRSPDPKGVMTIIPAKFKLPGGTKGVGYRRGIAGAVLGTMPEPRVEEFNRLQRGPRPTPVVVSENCRPPHRLVDAKRSRESRKST